VTPREREKKKKTGRQNFVAYNVTSFNKANLTFYYTAIYGKLLTLIT